MCSACGAQPAHVKRPWSVASACMESSDEANAVRDLWLRGPSLGLGATTGDCIIGSVAQWLSGVITYNWTGHVVIVDLRGNTWTCFCKTGDLTVDLTGDSWHQCKAAIVRPQS